MVEGAKDKPTRSVSRGPEKGLKQKKQKSSFGEIALLRRANRLRVAIAKRYREGEKVTTGSRFTAPARCPMRAAMRVVAMLLAVFAVLHFANLDGASVPDASRDLASSDSAAPAAPQNPAIAEERATALAGLFGYLAERTKRVRECQLSLLLDSDCIFD